MTAPDLYKLAQQILTPKQFDAWKLCRWAGMSERQAAEILDIERSTIRDRLQRADRRYRPAWNNAVRPPPHNPPGAAPTPDRPETPIGGSADPQPLPPTNTRRRRRSDGRQSSPRITQRQPDQRTAA